MSERVFVDTSAYYALTDPRDDHHAQAVSERQRLIRGGSELYTTNAVLIELHGLILNRMDRDTAERVLEALYASATRIFRATERDETRARQIIHQQQDKEYTFTDAISFAVMQRLHLRQVWTYDHHFAQFGFTQEARCRGGHALPQLFPEERLRCGTRDSARRPPAHALQSRTPSGGQCH